MKFGKSLEKFGKKLLRQIFRIFITSEKINPARVNIQSVKRILIVRQDRRVGNLLLTTPLFELAANIFPNAKVDAIISDKLSALIENNNFINRVFYFNHADYIKHPFGFFKLVGQLKKNKYDLVIESSKPGSSSFLNGMIAYLSGGKFKVGFNTGNGSVFTNIHVEPDLSKHYYQVQQQLLLAFSNNWIEFKPRVFIDETKQKEYSENLRNRLNLQNEKKIIGIWIGARGDKKWSLDNFIKLYKEIGKNFNYSPLLLFGLEEENDYHDSKLQSKNKLRVKELNELKHLVSSLCCFICGDTGPLHLAFAMGVPAIGIFLKDNYTTYGYADGKLNFIIKPDSSEKMINDILNYLEIIC